MAFKSKKPIYKRWWFIAIVLIIAISVIGGSGDDDQAQLADDKEEDQAAEENKDDKEKSEVDKNKEEPKEEPKEEKRTEFFMGEHVKLGNVVLTVNNIRDSKGNEIFKPDEGNIFKIVDITINNISNEFYSVSSFWGFEIKDSEGYTYSTTFGAETKGSLDGMIPPGMKMKGEIAFEIPENVSATNLFFDYELWNDGQINFVLNQEFVDEGIYDNPAETIEIHDIGEILEFRNSEVTVNSIRYDQGGQYFGPEEGYEYAVVDITIENISDDSISLSSLLSYSMVDDEGYYYSISMIAETKGTIDGEVSAGQSKRGEVAFEIPSESESLYLILTNDIFENSGKIVKVK